ncbi:GATA transcription factor 11-like isoform X2 [Prosopis cineraria]|uniref:GATA transcription factor 11-like isoform X2 n=1 Tax=Prosopis cineraria TaxID=364024 RepID=UPI00241095A6|nr:GATA transcription factor 11-like isoform X2 [Prosopis cineraria]
MGINNMKDSWFFDKNFNGLSDEIFDDVIKFFDFPLEDVEANAMEEDWDAQFKCLEEPYFDAFSISPSGLCDKTRKGNPKLERISTTRAEISPIEVPETTKLAYIKSVPNPKVSSNGKDIFQFQIYSPVSVFESSSSSSGENASDQPVIRKRARSKRRPLSILSPLFSVPFISSSRAFQKPRRAAAAESDFETFLSWKPSHGPKEKQRKKDVSGLTNMKRSSSHESIISRKCMHCQVTKTPQWREGPMGPKTLCNACGVRYRSGRLYPEYRPAASPTFVASLHSNCHKKVLELRNRAISEADERGPILPLSSKPPRNSLG